jgi:hypothetical protein
MSVIINGDTGITTPAETVQGALTTTGNTILGDATTDTLNVGAGGLVKDASGNVGIGTASPVGKLDLISGAARMYFSNQSATAFFTAVNTANSAYAPMAINGSELILKTGDAERMRIDSSGNVGIGATPNLGTYNKELTLSSGAGQFCGLSIQNTTTGTSGGFTAYISNTLAYLFNRSNDALLLGTNNTERMRIDSSGNVGIGTASPTELLDVAGNVYCSGIFRATVDGTAAVPSIQPGPDNDTGIYRPLANTIGFSTAGIERMRIASSGIVTMSAYGAGTATFSAAGVISSVSDETWKIKDGVPLDPDAMLKKLEPGYWFYNEEKAPIFGEDRQLGFYAQNVNAAIGSEAAPTPEEGKPWGYYDRSVLAVTVMSLKMALDSIQELKAIVDAQAVRIAALES